MRTLTQPFMALRAHTMSDPASSISFHVSNMPFQPIKEASCSCFQHVPPNLLAGNPPMFHWCLTLQETKKNILYIYNDISHIGKRKIIFKQTLWPWKVCVFLRCKLRCLLPNSIPPRIPNGIPTPPRPCLPICGSFSGGNHGQITAGGMRTSWDFKKQFLCEQMSGANLWRYIRYTLPETKVALESQWLDDSFPFGKAYSQVLSSFQGVDGSCDYDKSNWQFGFVICITEIHHALFTYVMSFRRIVCFHQLPGTQRGIAPCDFGSSWCWDFLKRILGKKSFFLEEDPKSFTKTMDPRG